MQANLDEYADGEISNTLDDLLNLSEGSESSHKVLGSRLMSLFRITTLNL